VFYCFHCDRVNTSYQDVSFVSYVVVRATIRSWSGRRRLLIRHSWHQTENVEALRVNSSRVPLERRPSAPGQDREGRGGRKTAMQLDPVLDKRRSIRLTSPHASVGFSAAPCKMLVSPPVQYIAACRSLTRDTVNSAYSIVYCVI